MVHFHKQGFKFIDYMVIELNASSRRRRKLALSTITLYWLFSNGLHLAIIKSDGIESENEDSMEIV